MTAIPLTQHAPFGDLHPRTQIDAYLSLTTQEYNALPIAIRYTSYKLQVVLAFSLDVLKERAAL